MRKKHIAILAAVVLCFAAFDLAIYFQCTRRCLPDHGAVRKTKMISLEEYLPFAPESRVVRLDTDFTLEGELPVLDGAEGLYPVFSAIAGAIYPEEAVTFADGSFTPDSRLQMNNTLRAYRGVVDGTVDLAFCAGASEEQLDYAQQQGVELEFVPIGREAFVFLVNSRNPVENLSVEQLRGVFSGRYTSWSELGGDHQLIAPLQRLAGSGSQTMLLAFMKGEPVKKCYTAFLGSAIGFSFRYYVADVMENSGVKMLSVNGAYPSPENIRNGSYPIVSPFYVVYDKANPNPNVQRLVEWILSEEGQQIILQTGYTPIS